jgi:hypothetical protein
MRSSLQPDPTRPATPLLALGATGLAGLFAAVPLLAGSVDGFYSFMTAHLALAVHWWLPAAEAALWRGGAVRAGWRPPKDEIRFVDVVIGTGGFIAVVGALVGGPDPSPIDYAPHFDAPLFLGGVGMVYVGWLVAASWPIRAWRGKRGEPPTEFFAYAAAGLAAWISLANLVCGYIALPTGLPFTYGALSTVYGAGHTVQYAHVLTMAGLWAAMAGPMRWRGNGIAFATLMAVGAGAALWSPAIYFVADSVEQTRGAAWTMLLGAGLGSVAALAGVVALTGATRLPGVWLVGVTWAAFVAGGLIPAMSDRTALTLTAHYHGLLGAVSAVYLAALYEPAPYTRGLIFGSGAFLIGAGFFRLAPYPLPRKTAALTAAWRLDPIAAVLIATGAVVAGVALASVAHGAFRRPYAGGESLDPPR